MLKYCIYSLSFVAAILPVISHADETTGIAPSSVYNIASSTKSPPVKSDVNKPRLENYPSYNEFINAMYVYNKSQEDNIKPRIVIDLPTKPDHQPEYTFLENNADVTGRGETIPDPSTVSEQQK